MANKAGHTGVAATAVRVATSLCAGGRPATARAARSERTASRRGTSKNGKRWRREHRWWQARATPVCEEMHRVPVAEDVRGTCAPGKRQMRGALDARGKAGNVDGAAWEGQGFVWQMCWQELKSTTRLTKRRCATDPALSRQGPSLVNQPVAAASSIGSNGRH
ncbi:hypothetical protein ERJ75_001503100 [Trypanosoma vivax]|nr:hypothetical protein ERJ75_001503100 [Trypanosoma vivax]